MAEDLDRKDLLAFVNGDRNGAEKLLDRFSSPLLNYATHLLLGDRASAEDVVQDCFTKLWHHGAKLHQSDAPLYLRAWLFRVVRNGVLDLKRRPVWESDDAILERDDGQPSNELTMIQKERARFAMNLIDALPERQKAAILMAHFEAMGNDEISRVLEISVEAVESLLARARRSMKEMAMAKKELI